MKKIIIFGISDAGELAHFYFKNDSEFEISAFVVDRSYLPSSGEFLGLPVIERDSILEKYPPNLYGLFVAMGYSNLNQARKDKYLELKSMGYSCVSYVSSKATVLNAGAIGENCFILEDNTIQPFVKIGNNVTLWSGNHIGHHTKIDDHCFLASHIVVSGRVHIHESCFIGVNSTIRDHVSIGDRCVLGAGTILLGDAEPGGVYIGSATERSKVPSNRLRKI